MHNINQNRTQQSGLTLSGVIINRLKRMVPKNNPTIEVITYTVQDMYGKNSTLKIISPMDITKSAIPLAFLCISRSTIGKMANLVIRLTSKKTTVTIREANRSDGIAAFISDLKNGIYVVIVASLQKHISRLEISLVLYKQGLVISCFFKKTVPATFYKFGVVQLHHITLILLSFQPQNRQS